MGGPFTNWMPVNHPVAHLPTPDHVAQFLRTIECDYVFATGWQTHDFVSNLPASYKKFYFIQDYEPWFAGAEGAAATYSNNFEGNFVIAKWLQEKLAAEHGLRTTFVRLGVGQALKSPSPTPRTSPRTVLCYHKLRGHRGRGADLIEEFLRRFTGSTSLQIRVVGHEDPKVPGAHFLGELYGAELETLYADTDILVDLSRHRGIATMAMDMARYGTVSLLSAPEYGLDEYGFVNGVTSLHVSSVDDAVEKVLLLSRDEPLFTTLSNAVAGISENFDYQDTVKSMVPILEALS
jgi:hypothetical protein